MQAQRRETEQAQGSEAGREAQRGKQILTYSIGAGLALALIFLLVLRARRKRLQSVEQEKQQVAQELGQAQADLSDASRAGTRARRRAGTSSLKASPRRESALP